MFVFIMLKKIVRDRATIAKVQMFLTFFGVMDIDFTCHFIYV